MSEGEKKPDAGTLSGGPDKKIVYAVIAVAVVILAVVLVARFDFNIDMINPSSGKAAVASFARPAAVQTIVRNPVVKPTISIRPQVFCSGTLTACTNGCTDTMIDLDNCGACGTVCPKYSYSTPACSGGRCGFTCYKDYMDCNQNPADGCEAYVDNDDNNCGHCGNVCASGSWCSANVCREPLVSGAGPGTINPPQEGILR